MGHLFAPLLSVLLLLFPLALCLAADEVEKTTHGPPASAGERERGLTGELKIPITAAEEREARRRRDVIMPYLGRLQARKGMEKYLNAPDLEYIKQTLAQIEVGQEKGLVTPEPARQEARVELTLEKSVEIALKNNLGIRIAAATRDAVETTIPRARALFHPTAGLALIASGERLFPETGKSSSDVNTQSVTPFIKTLVPTGASVILSSDLIRDETQGATPSREFESNVTLSLVQPLLRGGRIYVATRPIRDAEYDLRIEEARLRAEVLRVIAAAKSAYYNTTLAEKVIEVIEAAIERDRSLIEASQALLQAGLVTKRDVFSAEVILGQDLARLADGKADLESAKNALLDTLGLPISKEVLLLDKEIGFQPVQLDLGRWIAVATANRPEILEIEERLKKSTLNIRVARNILLPQTDLVASYGRSHAALTFGNSLDFRGEVWSAGLIFSIPIGNVAARSELTRAEIEHVRLQEEILQRKRQVELEVRDSVIQLIRNLERMKALTAVSDQASAKLEVARARFALGLATNLDITDAQEDLLGAETDLLRAIVNYNIGLAELEARIAAPI